MAKGHFVVVFQYKIYNVKRCCLVSDYQEVEKRKDNKNGEAWVGYQVKFIDYLGDDSYIKVFTSRYIQKNGISGCFMTSR